MTKQLYIVFLFFSLACFSQKSKKVSVYFASDKFDLDQKGKNRLDSMTGLFNAIKIYLQGHCDSVGSFEYNDALSNKRVNEVKKYLLSKKVDEGVIQIKALGKRVLLNGNETESDRSLNRRVEIEFIGTPKDSIDVMSTIDDKKAVTISGVVLDDDNKPLIAEVSLNDKTGKEIAVTKSDKTGKYELQVYVTRTEDYLVIFFNDGTFINSVRINLSNPKLGVKDIRMVLPKLKGGKRYVLENFNFVGDTSQLLPESTPSLEALYKLMKKNKSLVIQVEGHVNYPNGWGSAKREKPKTDKYVPPGMNYEQFNQWLSDERAKMVYNFLIKKGISPKRLGTVGYGATKMVYPNATSEWEMSKNRRVEIQVVSFKKL